MTGFGLILGALILSLTIDGAVTKIVRAIREANANQLWRPLP